MTKIFRSLLIAIFILSGQCFAALSVETGQFAADTADAVTTVSSSFQGKAIILWSTGQTSNGVDDTSNAIWSLGFSDGTNHRCISYFLTDNAAATNTYSTRRDAAALRFLSDTTPTTLIDVTGVSFGASSFDITWSGTPAAAYLVNYILLGGSDITNVLVGTSNASVASTGDQTDTSVGFQGDFGMFLLGATGQVQANMSYGFAVSGSKEFTNAWGVDDAANMTGTIDAVGYTDSGNFLSYITNGAETVDVLASFGTAGNPGGWTSTGFEFNVSNASALFTTFPYLIVEGGQWDVGTTTLPTGGASQTISGMTFQPKLLAMAVSASTADATVTTNVANPPSPLSMFGAAVSTSTEAYAGAAHRDAVLNTAVLRASATGKIITGELIASRGQDFIQFNSDGWQITSEAGVTRANQAGWFAGTDNVAAPSCAAGQNIALLGVGCR